MIKAQRRAFIRDAKHRARRHHPRRDMAQTTAPVIPTTEDIWAWDPQTTAGVVAALGARAKFFHQNVRAAIAQALLVDLLVEMEENDRG